MTPLAGRNARWHGEPMRWLMVAVALAGCTVPLEDWGRVVGQAKCERDQRCGRLSASVDCKKPGVWSVSFPEQAALDARQVGYSPSSAAACIERLRSVSCTVDLLNLPECRATFPGRLPEGAPCGLPLSDACGPGLICWREDAMSFCGACVTATPRGEQPTLGHPCGWGLAPVRTDAGITVLTGSRCEPRAALGESCRDRDCLEWLHCPFLRGVVLRSDAGSDAGDTCEEPGGHVASAPPLTGPGSLGQACHPVSFGGLWCAAGLTCLDGGCIALSALDQPCTGHGDCLSLHCVEGACGPPVPLGAPCTTSNCAPGMDCQGTGDGGATCAPWFCP